MFLADIAQLSPPRGPAKFHQKKFHNSPIMIRTISIRKRGRKSPEALEAPSWPELEKCLLGLVELAVVVDDNTAHISYCW